MMIYEKIVEIMNEILTLDDEEIENLSSSSRITDFTLDPLDLEEILEEVNTEFGLGVPSDDIEDTAPDIETVSDIVEFIKERQQYTSTIKIPPDNFVLQAGYLIS